MTVQEVPTEIALQQSISKAQMCQDIFRYILNDKSLTRLTILDYILNEAEQLTTLSQALLELHDQQTKAQIEARKKIISEAQKSPQAVETEDVTIEHILGDEPKA